MANVAEEIGSSQVIKNPPERVVVFYLLKYLIFSPFSIPGINRNIILLKYKYSFSVKTMFTGKAEILI